MIHDTSPQWRLQSCPHCHGDLHREQSARHLNGSFDVEWVCLQCGRVAPDSQQEVLPRVSANELAS